MNIAIKVLVCASLVSFIRSENTEFKNTVQQTIESAVKEKTTEMLQDVQSIGDNYGYKKPADSTNE